MRARYTGRRRICHSQIGARSRLGGHSSTIARREGETKGPRRREGERERDERLSKPSSLAYLRRQWASHLRHGRRFSSSDRARVTHPRSCGDCEVWIATADDLLIEPNSAILPSPSSLIKRLYIYRRRHRRRRRRHRVDSNVANVSSANRALTLSR